jgi:hypothetical protein
MAVMATAVSASGENSLRALTLARTTSLAGRGEGGWHYRATGASYQSMVLWLRRAGPVKLGDSAWWRGPPQRTSERKRVE